MPEKNSLKKIVFVLSVITLGLLAGVAIMSFLLVQKQNELRETEQGSAQNTQNELLVSRYQTLLKKTETDRQKLETYMVRGDADTAALLGTIEMLAEQQGIPVTENVAVEKVASTTRALLVTLETKGEYQKVMSFLESLQSLPHEIAFRDVALRRSSEIAEKSALWTLSAALLVKSFEP
jgi:Tfp pilus assembly protein PilO